VDNADWYESTSITDFLATVGRHFRVGTMLGRHSVQSRMSGPDGGISFTEFSYQALQANDWLHLLKHHGCRFQVRHSTAIHDREKEKEKERMVSCRLVAVIRWATSCPATS